MALENVNFIDKDFLYNKSLTEKKLKLTHQYMSSYYFLNSYNLIRFYISFLDFNISKHQ